MNRVVNSFFRYVPAGRKMAGYRITGFGAFPAHASGNGFYRPKFLLSSTEVRHDR
jgi:hypothetical protein